MGPSTQQRIAQPVNRQAAEAANAAIRAGTGGRLPDPISPEDAGLREKWLRAYVSAGGKLEPEQPASPAVGATIKTCPRRYILLEYQHADGTPVAGARYVVESHEGEVWYEGTLDKQGRAWIDNVPPERSAFKYYFLADPEANDLALKPSEVPDQQATQSVVESMLDWLWGTLQGDFNPDPSISQTAVNTLLGLIPVVDQVLDLRDIVAGVKHLIEYYAESAQEQAQHKPVIGLDYEVWLWLNLFIIAMGCIPEVGSAVKGVLRGLIVFLHKRGAHAVEKLAPELWWYLIKIFNYFGKSNAHLWLKRLPDNLSKWMDDAATLIRKCLDAVQATLRRGREYASSWLAGKAFGQQKMAELVEIFNQAMSSIQRVYSRLDSMKARINEWLRDQVARILLGKRRHRSAGAAGSDIEPRSNILRQEVQEPPETVPRVPEPRPLRPVQMLDVDSYGSQTQRSVPGDRLQNDHIPSFAAAKKAAEQKLGRRLDDEEAKALREHLTSMTEPEEVHRSVSRTYGGRNTPEKVLGDARNLREAAQNDMEALRDALVRSGKSPEEVERAFQAVHIRNERIGLYDGLDRLLNMLGIK